MKTRCMPGDMAMIIREEPGCEANLGRCVYVSGPALYHHAAGLTWLITPVTGHHLSYVGAHGLRIYANVHSGIEHPDAWMVPIHPNTLEDLEQALGVNPVASERTDEEWAILLAVISDSVGCD